MEKHTQINNRHVQIESIHKFISTSKQYLNDILHELDWSEEATYFKEGEKILQICPQNEEHRVSFDNLQKHLIKCCWHQSGYRDDSLALPEAGGRSATTVVLDKNLQAEIILEAAQQNPALKIGHNIREREVPQTSDRVFSDFTTDERRILYDYVVSKTSAAVPRLNEFSLPVGEESKTEPLTKEQMMSLQRDAKRRRIRYRTAKVHTKSKNYSEVMREVINNQMVAYEDWLREQCNVAGPSTSIPLDKANTGQELAAKNCQQMVWLDWDYRTNPYVRWKHLLEKEKRRARKQETDSSCSQDHSKTYNKSSTSRRNSPSDQSLYHRKHRYGRDHDERNSKSRVYNSRKDHHRVDYERSYRRVDSSRRERTDYDGRHNQRVFKDNGYQGKDEWKKAYKNDTRLNKYQSKKDGKYENNHSKNDFKGNIKTEFKDYSDNNSDNLIEYPSDQIQKSSDKYKFVKYESTSTESGEMSSDTKKQRKRKASKKKAKKKHKKKHKSKHSRRDSTSRSSD